MKLNKKWLAAALITLNLVPVTARANCVCLLPDIALLIQQHAAVDAAGHAGVQAVLNLYLPQINDGIAKLYAANEQAMAHRYGMNDRLIHEMYQSAQEQVAAENDGAVARSVIGGAHPAACSMGQQDQKVGVSLNTSAAVGRAIRQADRAAIKRTSNPRTEITFINALPERQLVAEMTASDAGTMTDQQFNDALVYKKVITPVPPTSPDQLPGSIKGTPQGRQYEKEFKRYAAVSDLYSKMFNRDLQLSVRSIEVNNNPNLKNVNTIWSHITSGLAMPADLKQSSGDASSFPDQWGGIAPVTVNGSQYISERDFMRTGVMMRYANPQYQSDPEYGLASMTMEGMMKEFIKMQALQNRMLYEIMNTELHEKMADGLKGAWETDAYFKPLLNGIASDAMR